MKKILIVGVSGFIGRSLYNRLSTTNDVYGIAKSEVELPQCDKIDIHDKKALKLYLNQHFFDSVINLASVMAQFDNLEDINVLYDNLRITTSLLEAIQDNNTAHFINFSSSSVYSNISGSYSEGGLIDASENTDCLYGLSKFNSEVLFSFFLKKRGVLITHLRIPMVHGKQMNESRIHKVFEKELRSSNTITVWGNGERIISQISIEELCSKVEGVIRKEIVGTFNLMGESISTLELAERTIKNHGNAKSKVILLPKGSKEKFILDGKKLERLLND